MVITLVSDSLNSDSKTAGFSAFNLARQLSGHGHEIRIVTYAGLALKENNIETEFEVFYIPQSKFLTGLWNRAILKSIKKAVCGSDAVHVFQPSILGWTAAKAAKKLKVPVIAGFYTEPEHTALYLFLRFLFYRNFLHIHCIDKHVAAHLRSYGYKAWLHVISDKLHPRSRTIKRMERMYLSLSNQNKSDFAKGCMFRLLSRLFYTGFAVPLMQFWMRVVLGARIRGKKNLKGVRSAVTVCNHVHFLDSVLVGLAVFPRKATFPTFVKNVRTLWPGKIVRILGGVAIPESLSEVNTFFNELEFLLIKNHIVHFFPEGVLRPYDTDLISFRKGAFHLAAQARVPIVPMLITFDPPKGLYKLIRKKPVMTLHVGKPMEPYDEKPENDMRIRMELIYEKMNSFAKRNKAS
jgi:1-acyl-sn-glycerol-3-phosphate acyltransferase